MVLYGLLAVFLNCCVEMKKAPEPTVTLREQEPSSSQLAVVTWNHGYAGLGKESDFKMDGGERLRVPSKAIARKNAQFLAEKSQSLSPDIYFVQELSGRSFLNRGIDAEGLLDEELADYSKVYVSDFRTRLIPPPLRIKSGLAVFFRQGVFENAESVLLTQEPRRFGLRKNYQALIVRLKLNGDPWTFINTHLAAFDDQGAVRTAQLKEVLALGVREERAGRKVILGGDWNLRLVETSFENDTEEEFLFWLEDFPGNALPTGWRIITDHDVPSVRTLERSFKRRENYTAVIDGFIVSPEVQVDRVQTSDFGFEASDHQPVSLRLSP